MAERPNERFARHIVGHALGVAVEHNDDGTRPGQVDALIYNTTPPSALEVVGDHDERASQQLAALQQKGYSIEIPDLRHPWVVTITRGAQISQLHDEIASAIRPVDQRSDGRTLVDDPDPAMRKLGIVQMQPDRLAPPGRPRVRFEMDLQPGWVTTEIVPQFVENLLNREKDVSRKLSAHPAPQRHAFIWATLTSDAAIHSTLEQGSNAQLPPRDPTLPDGVTHVWVASELFPRHILAWFPDRAWWAPTWPVPPGDSPRA